MQHVHKYTYLLITEIFDTIIYTYEQNTKSY